jgi:hypothetical protein
MMVDPLLDGVPDVARDDWAEVVAWRRRQLLAGGFGTLLADRLASTPGVDLHRLLSLVDRGCPPATAVRIAGPDGWSEPA